MADTTNLLRRGDTWYVRVFVPRKHRSLIGKAELLKTTGTASLQDARAARARIMYELQTEISRRVLAAETAPDTAEFIVHVARGQREAVNDGRMDEESASAGLDATVEDYLDKLRRKRTVDDEGHPELTDTEGDALTLAHRVFAGEEPVMVSDLIQKHLREEAPRVTPSALQDKKRRLESFSVGWQDRGF